jgi:hypothetical protein
VFEPYSIRLRRVAQLYCNPLNLAEKTITVKVIEMVKFNGVNHLAMATGDMDRTIRFWRDLLGMRLVAGLGRPGYRHYFFQLSDTDLVAFFEWSEVKPMPKKDHLRKTTEDP